jgi:hypothetical protein
MNSAIEQSTLDNVSDQIKFLKDLLSKCPPPADEAERNLYAYLQFFMDQEPSDDWFYVMDCLITIFKNRDKWDVVSTSRWEEGGLYTFSGEVADIIKIVTEDLGGSRDRNVKSVPSKTCITMRGEPIFDTDLTIRRWRNYLTNTIDKVVKGYMENPQGDPNSHQLLETSIVGYVLSFNAIEAIHGGAEPEYFGDKTMMWNRSSWEDQGNSMEVYVTATHAGHITYIHEDGPAMESMVWHILGIKLWVVWDGSIENYEILNSKHKPWEIPLDWAFENLKGAKVSIIIIKNVLNDI